MFNLEKINHLVTELSSLNRIEREALACELFGMSLAEMNPDGIREIEHISNKSKLVVVVAGGESADVMHAVMERLSPSADPSIFTEELIVDSPTKRF